MEVWRFCCYLQIVDCISVEVGTIDFLPKVFSVENKRTYLNPYFKNFFSEGINRTNLYMLAKPKVVVYVC